MPTTKEDINLKDLYDKVHNKGKLLEYALDIRKFEIELYWKRATYFWAFIAVIFAGYFVVLSANKILYQDKLLYQCLLSSLGFVFSIAWYFVNRGSKFWQVNWESHVDIHEDEVIGPLLKTTLSKDQFIFFDLTGPFAFSVSKINILLSLYVSVIWLILFVKSIVDFFSHIYNNTNNICFILVIIIITLVSVFVLFIKGKSSGGKDIREFELSKPEYIIRKG